MSPSRPTLEVCIGSLDDALAASDGGADRLELCGALELGGLTPSIGLVEQVIETVSLPVVAMVRPRAGGFVYSPSEHATMLRDARRILDAGAVGIVFGCLRADGSIDEERTTELAAIAGSAQSVFHRAFDFVSDTSAALDALIASRVTRVLTTGGPPSAIAGADALRGLVDRAGSQIQILAGGGVRGDHVAELIGRSGVSQVHIGAAVSALDPTSDAGLSDLRRLQAAEHRVVSVEVVRDVASQLRE